MRPCNYGVDSLNATCAGRNVRSLFAREHDIGWDRKTSVKIAMKFNKKRLILIQDTDTIITVLNTPLEGTDMNYYRITVNPKFFDGFNVREVTEKDFQRGDRKNNIAIQAPNLATAYKRGEDYVKALRPLDPEGGDERYAGFDTGRQRKAFEKRLDAKHHARMTPCA